MDATSQKSIKQEDNGLNMNFFLPHLLDLAYIDMVRVANDRRYVSIEAMHVKYDVPAGKECYFCRQ